VEPVLDAEAEELVPRGVEVDLVDPLAEAVVGAEDRRVLVREPSELERTSAAEPSERRAPLFGRGAAVTPERPTSGRFSEKRSYPSSGGGWFAARR
jgi:hypothetical protein